MNVAAKYELEPYVHTPYTNGVLYTESVSSHRDIFYPLNQYDTNHQSLQSRKYVSHEKGNIVYNAKSKMVSLRMNLKGSTIDIYA
ncbi:MAG: hypothetical protein HQK77_09485 [Desulfobacterales bacterium]|nr:hypothetical protein [Desulfobacterales bacterium]